MINGCGVVRGKRMVTETRNAGKEPASVSLNPPKTPHDLNRNPGGWYVI
jgi:hypothetical protein